MKFNSYNISEEIKRNLEGMGFKKPTDIQYKCIPPILRREDVLAIAQTGTGKTAAFAIPVLSVLNENKRNRSADGVKCLVMAPTHELALQISEVFSQLERHTKVSSACIYGGIDQAPQIQKLQAGVDVLIATPGRLFDLVSQKHLDLTRIEILILDEADKMLDLGFYKDIRQLIHHLPKKRQTLFFSATINEEIKDLAYSLVDKPIRIQLSPKDPVSKNVDHSVAYIAMDDKRFFLERLAKEDDTRKILVFVRTKVRAERVLAAMDRVGVKSLTLHGDKDQKEREEALNAFKKGEIKLLITTDVSARGIDIPGINMVINYDLPDVAENYVHRVGRTGRGMSKGIAVSFCSPEEKEMLNEIETYITKPVKVLDIDKQSYTETIDFSEDKTTDLKSLMEEIEFLEDKHKKSKKSKNKKK
ncbi:MAG: DEAD/DEAH box helicase [Cytophagaceae bacterium]